VPPLQPRHGGKLHPQRDFPYGRRCHGRKPTSSPSGVTTMDDWRRPAFGTHMLDQDRCHDEATQPADGPQPWSEQTHCLSASLYSGWRGFSCRTSLPLRPWLRSYPLLSAEERLGSRPPRATPRALHLRSPPMGWTGCTINWQKFMPSPPRS
jgi:hypothetical protein